MRLEHIIEYLHYGYKFAPPEYARRSFGRRPKQELRLVTHKEIVDAYPDSVLTTVNQENFERFLTKDIPGVKSLFTELHSFNIGI